VRFLELLSLAQLWAAPPAEAEKHAASITGIIFPLVNFLIFLYLVKLVYDKGIPGFPAPKELLRSRRQDIVDAINEADEGKKQAEEKVRNYQERLSRLAIEARQIQEALRAEGERGKVRLLAEAENLAAKIKADATFLTEQEVKVARQQIRAEIARVAQEAARKTLQRYFTQADQKRLVEEFLTQLGGAK